MTSTKSFPSYTQVRKDLTTEATATSVEDNADWGGIENLDVPQTESQVEKDAAAAKKAAEEEAKKQAEVEAQATQEQANAGSRNESRSSVTYSDASGSVSAGAGASIDRAYSLIGQSMDCTALVSQALAARGINFHGWPEEYVNVPGGHVVTDGSLQPGDILIYANTGGWNGGAHYDHVALYVGNGQAVHGGWNGYSVALASAMTESSPSWCVSRDAVLLIDLLQASDADRYPRPVAFSCRVMRPRHHLRNAIPVMKSTHVC